LWGRPAFKAQGSLVALRRGYDYHLQKDKYPATYRRLVSPLVRRPAAQIIGHCAWRYHPSWCMLTSILRLPNLGNEWIATNA